MTNTKDKIFKYLIIAVSISGMLLMMYQIYKTIPIWATSTDPTVIISADIVLNIYLFCILGILFVVLNINKS